MGTHACLRRLAFAAAALACAPLPATAQPFGGFLYLDVGGVLSHGYVEVPHSSALDTPSAITVEAWLDPEYSPTSDEDCRSIVGKDWTRAWWVGLCNVGGVHTLVSYVKGGAVPLYAGVLPMTRVNHIAVTHDGTTRRHYVNGELVGSLSEPGPLPTSNAPLRIGSDVEWPHSMRGLVDEVRLWRVARTAAQIRSTINVPLATPQPGLVAVWALDGNGLDSVGGHHGTVKGSGWVFPPITTVASCDAYTTNYAHCLHHRFLVRVYFRTGPPGSVEDWARVVEPRNLGSVLYWFFGPDNWEVMLKIVNACGPFGRWWVYSAATTDLFYRIEVWDVKGGGVKQYFNYPGPPAAAVTDSNAFATCP